MDRINNSIDSNMLEHIENLFEISSYKNEFIFPFKNSIFFDTIFKWKDDDISEFFFLKIITEEPERLIPIEIFSRVYMYDINTYPDIEDYLTRKMSVFKQMILDINTICNNDESLFCKNINYLYLSKDEIDNCKYRKKQKSLQFITNSINTCCVCLDEVSTKLNCCNNYICLICYNKLHKKKILNYDLYSDSSIINWEFSCPCCRSIIDKITNDYNILDNRSI